MTTTTAKEQPGLGWPPDVLGDSGSILEITSMRMYPPVPLPGIKVPHSEIHGACPIRSDEGMEKA